MPLGDENPSIGSTCAHQQSLDCKDIVNYLKDKASFILANIYLVNHLNENFLHL